MSKYKTNKTDAFKGFIKASKNAPIKPSLGTATTVAGLIKK